LETSLESPESDYMKHLLLGSLDNVLNKLNSESDGIFLFVIYILQILFDYIPSCNGFVFGSLSTILL